jgi:hypothetical protein
MGCQYRHGDQLGSNRRRIPIRLVLFAIMLVALVMASG